MTDTPLGGSTLFEQVRLSTSAGPFHETEASGAQPPDQPLVKLIAFYLPQFHPIPENDQWWGKGFTEWTNVTRATPRFRGHVQPRLPADLGFYDLRNVETIYRQAELARRYGIGGFCFHHYWFGGRSLLERPLELFLANRDIDIPFCIDWANENWTRRWDGQEHEVLLGQTYSPEFDIAFARSLFPIVADPRYIHIDGRPLIMIYRPSMQPDPLAAARRWRTEFMRAGLGNPYIVMAQSFGDADPRLFGLDAAVEFPPHKLAITPSINGSLDLFDSEYASHVMDYHEVARWAASLPRPPYRLFRCVCPSWDNEARRPGRGLTLAFSDPVKYGEWLAHACRTALAEASHSDERIVFINAWNEWAEGAYLEPDRHYGHAYLATTARVLSDLEAQPVPPPDIRVPSGQSARIALISHDALLYGAQVVALAVAKSLVRDHGVALNVLLGGPGELAQEFAAVAPTELVEGEFSNLDAWRLAFRRLAASGVTAVICSSLASAKAIGPLREAGLQIVQLVHELPSLIRQYGLEAAARDAAAHAAAIVFPSPYVRDRFIELAGPASGQLIIRHQGVHLRHLSSAERERARVEFRKSWGLDLDTPVVLGIGSGDARKGLDLWPRLILRVVADQPDALFFWVGKADPALVHWVTHDLRASGNENRLLFLPPRPDLAAVYAAADVYALTSREDPFPSVVLEAMASGLPVVAFDGSGGIPDLVREAGGACVPYLDVDAMGREVSRLISDLGAARAIGARMRRYIEPQLDYRGYAGLLLELAGGRSAGVTVVVPNFNYARHLPQRIESIWAQTYPISEIILLDDASTDGSDAVIAELAARSPLPIRVVHNEENSGSVARQWARGVSMVQTELVWIAEADDFAERDFLAATVAAFADPDVVLSYSESRMVDEDGRVLGENYLGYVADIDPHHWTKDFKVDAKEEIARAFAVKNTIPNVSAAVFRTAPLQAVLRDHLEGMIDLRNASDWLCYLRLLELGGKLAFTARSLNNHRRHQQSVTLAAADRRHWEEIAAMQALAADIAKLPTSERARSRGYLARVAAQFGLEDAEPLDA